MDTAWRMWDEGADPVHAVPSIPAYRGGMTRLPRAIVALAPLALVLVACAPATPDAASPSPTRTPSLEATAATPAAGVLPEGEDIAEWASQVLPENRPGGAAPVLVSSGPVSPDRPAVLDVSQAEGMWDLLLTCQSADGTALSWEIDSPTSSVPGPTEQACPSPQGGIASTALIGFDGPGAVLRLTAAVDTVYAIQVRPHHSGAD